MFFYLCFWFPNLNTIFFFSSGFWIWSGKTVDAWASLLKPLCAFRTFNKAAGGGGGGANTNRRGAAGKPNPPPLPLPRVLGAPNSENHAMDNHYSTIPRNHYI